MRRAHCCCWPCCRARFSLRRKSACVSSSRRAPRKIFQRLREIRGERRRETVRLAAEFEFETLGMQEQAPQTGFAKTQIHVAQAVLFVAGKRMAGVLRMHADL